MFAQLALAGLLIAATSGTFWQQVPVQLPASPNALPQGPWQWLGSDRADGSVTQPADPTRYTIEFRSAGAVTIQADCNTVLGTFSRSGAALQIQLGPTTLVACPPGSSADEFKQDLAGVTGFSVTAGQLLLHLGSGDGTMTFAATPPPDAVGTVWRANGVNNGRGGVVSLLADTTLTLVFGPGSVSGSAGCNQFRGPYTRTGDAISLGPLALTRMQCSADVMEQEAAYVAALQAATSMTVHGNELWLSDADGATQAIFVPASSGVAQGA